MVRNTNGIASVEDIITVTEVEKIEEALMAQFLTLVRADGFNKIEKECFMVMLWNILLFLKLLKQCFDILIILI